MDWLLENSLSEEKGIVCGVDEAGRGPLAGPVFAAAVILPKNIGIEGLNDSKKLSAAAREKLFDEICKNAVDFSIAHAEEYEIDKMNIVNATMLAMRRAVEGLRVKPDYLLVDGNIARDLPLPAKTVVKGDGRIPSIAAASILAKVARDRFMVDLDRLYPRYKFAKHKGYPTKEHREIIKEFGICPAHRRSYMKKITGEVMDETVQESFWD